MPQLTSNIKQERCQPCEGGVKPLTPDEYEAFLRRELADWAIRDQRVLKKEYKFKNFKEALAFLNQVAALAEEEGHHPDMQLFEWNKVKVSLTTHAIGGLSKNDFIVASKVNGLQV
jgi:4a-hydroxytetrahydrobiopterin dehydratase